MQAGWQPDPTARHEYRYWDGNQWTDDVSDGGVTSVDPVSGPGAGPVPPGDDPTAAMTSSTAVFSSPAAGPGDPGAPVAPPYAGDPYAPGPYPSGPPGPYASGAPMAPTPPARKGPNPALVVALVVVIVALIGGGAYALTSGGDDGDDTTESADGGTDTTEPSTDTTTGDAGSGDDPGSSTGDDPFGSGGDDGGSGGDDPMGGPGSDILIDSMASAFQAQYDLSEEQASCMAEGLMDEFGIEGLSEIGTSGANSLSSGDMTALFDIAADCDVSPDDLAGTGAN